jgi:hypothetical protein
MTYDEFTNKVKEIIPSADFDTDNYDQIIIYTNLKVIEHLESGDPYHNVEFLVVDQES